MIQSLLDLVKCHLILSDPIILSIKSQIEALKPIQRTKREISVSKIIFFLLKITVMLHCKIKLNRQPLF